MKKSELIASVQMIKTEIKDVLQTVFDELNQGQQKKIVEDEKVRTLFDRYGVEYEE